MLSDNVILPNGLDLTSMLQLMNAKTDEIDTFSGFSYARFHSPSYRIESAMDAPLKPFKPAVFGSRGDIPYDPETGLFTAAAGQMYIFMVQFVMNTSSTSWGRIRHFITQTRDNGATWDDYIPSIRNLEIYPPLTPQGASLTPNTANSRHAFPLSLQILSYNASSIDASSGNLKFAQGMQLETTRAYPIELGIYGLVLHFNTWES